MFDNVDILVIIPTYLEIEVSSEKENCDDIYRQIYNIDISKIKKLKF